MWTERLIETAAMMMIGDGLLAMVERPNPHPRAPEFRRYLRIERM